MGKTAPGDIIKPMLQNFDPLATGESKTEWEVMEDCDCPSIDNVAQADTTDIDTLKKACETQLKRKGIDVGVFVLMVNVPISSSAVARRHSRRRRRARDTPCTSYPTLTPRSRTAL